MLAKLQHIKFEKMMKTGSLVRMFFSLILILQSKTSMVLAQSCIAPSLNCQSFDLKNGQVSKEANLFVNPSTDQWNIQFGEVAQLTFVEKFSNSGQVLLAKKNITETLTKLENVNFPKGIYTFKITNINAAPLTKTIMKL